MNMFKFKVMKLGMAVASLLVVVEALGAGRRW